MGWDNHSVQSEAEAISFSFAHSLHCQNLPTGYKTENTVHCSNSLLADDSKHLFKGKKFYPAKKMIIFTYILLISNTSSYRNEIKTCFTTPKVCSSVHILFVFCYKKILLKVFPNKFRFSTTLRDSLTNSVKWNILIYLHV